MFIKILFNYQGERTQGKCVDRANRPDITMEYGTVMTAKIGWNIFHVLYNTWIHEIIELAVP